MSKWIFKHCYKQWQAIAIIQHLPQNAFLSVLQTASASEMQSPNSWPQMFFLKNNTIMYIAKRQANITHIATWFHKLYPIEKLWHLKLDSFYDTSRKKLLHIDLECDNKQKENYDFREIQNTYIFTYEQCAYRIYFCYLIEIQLFWRIFQFFDRRFTISHKYWMCTWLIKIFVKQQVDCKTSVSVSRQFFFFQISHLHLQDNLARVHFSEVLQVNCVPLEKWFRMAQNEMRRRRVF